MHAFARRSSSFGESLTEGSDEHAEMTPMIAPNTHRRRLRVHQKCREGTADGWCMPACYTNCAPSNGPLPALPPTRSFEGWMRTSDFCVNDQMSSCGDTLWAS